MLANVESVTPSLNSRDKILLKAGAETVQEQIMPWRRRSRLRRILNGLRSLRRQHQQLMIVYWRIDRDVYLELRTEQDLLLFRLLWPPELPPWQRVAL